jgi:asparagine synthase (glutamine-hydrolysing)
MHHALDPLTRPMTPRLLLSPERWARHNLTHACGQALDRTGKLLRASEVASLFDGLPHRDAWPDAAATLNGSFSVVKTDAAEVRAAVDRLRCFPLFFARTEDQFLIADQADTIHELLPHPRVDPICMNEFRLTGYVTGSQTLVEGVEQIRAGHCLFISPADDRGIEMRPYYEFRHKSFLAEDDKALIDKIAETHRSVFSRLLRDVGDRPIMVPLSGGYDSRLIGVMLRDLGHANVICYSYGAEGNWESKISKELAEYLGFRWTMIPYTPERWRVWAATPEFQRYFRRAGNLSAVSHIQDWPAVYELQRRGDIPRDAVFVPGHSGDFLAGSHIPKWYASQPALTREDILRSLFDVHFSLWDWPADEKETLRRALAERIERVIGPIRTSTPEEAADAFERWDCHERQAKFIVNSVRVYESFGYEWRLPLFDAELMDFWSRVPIEGRIGRRLYFEFVKKHQQLPITPANMDHSAPIATANRLVDRLGLRPFAKRAQRALRRIGWRHQYDGDNLAWFGLVDPQVFRARYTGREIGHSFFALQYLDLVTR